MLFFERQVTDRHVRKLCSRLGVLIRIRDFFGLPQWVHCGRRFSPVRKKVRCGSVPLMTSARVMVPSIVFEVFYLYFLSAAGYKVMGLYGTSLASRQLWHVAVCSYTFSSLASVGYSWGLVGGLTCVVYQMARNWKVN